MSYEPPGFSRKFVNKYENSSTRHSSLSNGEKPAFNGVVGSFGRQDESNERRNYKLLIDPAIKKGHQKIYRFDGVFPGQLPVVPKDPRSRRTRIWKQIKADLPVPNFKVDKNYVGIPPQREVLFTGLNDNVDKKFLQEMCERYGKIENIKIYYDAVTKKHSGKGRVTFSTTSAAKITMSKLDSTSVMGNIIRATLEPNLKGFKNTTKQHRGEHQFVRRGSNEEESVASSRRISAVAPKFLTHLPTPPCSMNSQSPLSESSVSTPIMLADPRLDTSSTLKPPPPPPPPPLMDDVSPNCASSWDKTHLSLKLSQPSSLIPPQNMTSTSFEPISPPPVSLRTKELPPPPPPGRPPSPPEEAPIASQHPSDKAHSSTSYMNFEDISPDPVFSPEENNSKVRSTHQMKTEVKAASKDNTDEGKINRLIESCRRNSARSSHGSENKGRSPRSDSSWSRERKSHNERDDRRERYRDKDRGADGRDRERSERDHGYSPRERRFEKHSDFKGGYRHRKNRWTDRREDRREDYRKYDKRDDHDRSWQYRRDRYSTSPRQADDRRRSESLDVPHRDKVNDCKIKEQEAESRTSDHLYQDINKHVMDVKTNKEPELHRASNNETVVRVEESVPFDSGGSVTPTQTKQNHSQEDSSSSEGLKVTNAAEIISLVVSGDPQAKTKETGLYDGEAYTVGIEACSDEEPLPPGDEGDVADKVNKDRSRNKLKAAQDNIRKRKYSTDSREDRQENSVKAKKQIQIVVKSRQLSETVEPGLPSAGTLDTSCKEEEDNDDSSETFKGGWRTVSIDQTCESESNNLLDETSEQEGLDLSGNLPVVEDISPCPSPASVQVTECTVTTTTEAVIKTSEEPASTQLYSDIEGNDDSGGGNDDNDDDDDAMSLSSISSNEDTFQVNEPVKKMSPRRKQLPVSVPPPRIPFLPFPPPPPSFNLSVPPPAPFNPMVPPPPFGRVPLPPPPLHPVGVPPSLCPPSSVPRVPPPSIPPPSVPPMTVPPPPLHPTNVPPPPIHPSAVPHMTIPPPGVPPPTGPPHIPPPPMRNPGFYDGVSLPHYHSHGSKYQETPPPPPPPRKTWKGIVTDEVYSAVSSELVKMVNRDVFRKLIETSAFKALEAWWDNQTKPKQSSSQLATPTPGTHPPHSHTPSTVGQPSNMSSASTMLGPSPFERQHSMVLGIKASLPKLPSFKVKRTVQPPKNEELVTPSHKRSVTDSLIPIERANKRPCLDDGEVDTDLEISRGSERRQRTTSRMEEEERSESPWQHLDDNMDAAPPATRVRSTRDIVEAERRTSTGSSLYHTVYSSSEEGSDGDEESESGESEAEGSAAESGEDEEESEAETEEETDEESDEEPKEDELHDDVQDDGVSSTGNLSSTAISARQTELIQRTVETVTLSERTNYQAQRAAAMDDVTSAAWFARPVPHADVKSTVEVNERESETAEERTTDTGESETDAEGVEARHTSAAQSSSEADELVISRDGHVYSPPRVTAVPREGRVDRASAPEDAELQTGSDNDEVFTEEICAPDFASSKSRAVSLVELDHSYGMSASEDEPAPVYKDEPVLPPHQLEAAAEEEWQDKAVCENQRVRSPIIDVENGVAEPLFLPEKIIPPEPIIVKPSFPLRSYEEDDDLVYEMLRCGIDSEDARYLKIGFERLLQVGSESVLDAHWGYHPVCPQSNTVSCKRRKQRLEHGVRVHATGCARTEGYYKLSMSEKARYLETARRQLQVQENLPDEQQKIDSSKARQQSREHRLVQRRLQSAVIKEDYGDLLKFNQLRVRKKQLKFAKSAIHDWGLFALEPIAADEMVIEYVGEMIRQQVADLRERRYEEMGIGSSYMFRVDQETIIDATTLGNLARFINHCCDPNCYARIISVENNKKIVIYSKRDIKVNEEITYDYKFPIEEEKIPCLCGVSQCRGTLN